MTKTRKPAKAQLRNEQLHSEQSTAAVEQNTDLPPAEQFLDFLEQNGMKKWAWIIILLFALYVRSTIGLNVYSGYKSPPKYGDYEAQRHWMELTLHVPIEQWYYYDLEWWGLDYPPITAYVSWLCGKIGSAFNPEWFALDTSRGFESPESKVFMRTTVLVLDYLIYVPAVFVFANWWLETSTWRKKNLAILLILLQPALILIDHGHFQYNSVMLGLTLWAINCFLYDYDVLGSVFFCLSLGFKQMSLYYSPVIFSYLLGKCLKNNREGLILFLKLGLSVIATFILVFWPFLDSFEHISQVIFRIFPFQRGLYEDKVANVWCAINVIIKLREIFAVSTLAKISLIATVSAVLPSCIAIGRNPDKRQLLYALANSALAFFLFSFQVHEKSILLPSFPIVLLIIDEPLWSPWFINIATFSLYPLLKKEELSYPYFVVWSLWNWSGKFFAQHDEPLNVKLIFWISHLMTGILQLVENFYSPPSKYPDLYVVLNVLISSGLFIGFFGYFNYQLIVGRNRIMKGKQKEN